MVRKKGFPEPKELVVCRVDRITPFAAWCELLEYPGLQGMIHVSEVAGRHVHDIRRYVKKDKQYVTKVMRVDREKKVVELSLKRVSQKEKERKMNEFKKENRAEKILEQAASKVGKSLEEAYEEVGFLLQENFDSLFSAFEKIRKRPQFLDELGIPARWRKALLEAIEKSFEEREVWLRGELKLKFYSGDGIERVKKVLKSLEEKDERIDITYISAPRYLVRMRTTSPKEDEKKLRTWLEEAVEMGRSLGGEASYEILEE